MKCQTQEEGVEDFREVVERYKSLVWSIAYACTGEASLSDDVAQETFLAAWKQQGELRDPAKLRGYLATIARNLGRKAMRGTGREILDSEHAESLDAGEQSNPLEQVLQQEQASQLADALRKMPEPSREAFVLFYTEGQSVARVASDLDLSQSAVKQRLFRARENLKSSLQAELSQALTASNPGKAFVTATMIMILGHATEAGAALTGAAATSTASAPTSTGAVGVASKAALSMIAISAVVAIAIPLTSRFSADSPKAHSVASSATAARGTLSFGQAARPQRRLAGEAAIAEATPTIASADEPESPAQEMLRRIQGFAPTADIDGDGQLSEDEMTALRDAQEDELTEQILEHWQDEPYGVTCAFVGPDEDEGVIVEGYIPYNLYGLRASYEQELKKGLDMSEKQWLSSKVANAQNERICYEIMGQYHDEAQ